MAGAKSGKDLAEQRKAQFRKLVAENTLYPLATVTYHGPSPSDANTITVGILPGVEEPPIVKQWSGAGIAEDEGAAREIGQFIKEHDVARVLTSEWVLSCPHEEGVDYPLGQVCPYCPAWH